MIMPENIEQRLEILAVALESSPLATGQWAQTARDALAHIVAQNEELRRKPHPFVGEAVQMDDPEATPEMQALQIRYQDAIALVMLQLLEEPQKHGSICMINALGHHLVIAIRAMRNTFVAGAVERMVKRLERHLRED